jgi:glucose-fructose oxidoreductase
MPSVLRSTGLCCVLFIAMFLALPFSGLAQQPPAPLRVAIVGLVHDHVAGFLAQLPQHHDVELVGIAEPDPALQAKYQKPRQDD